MALDQETQEPIALFATTTTTIRTTTTSTQRATTTDPSPAVSISCPANVTEVYSWLDAEYSATINLQNDFAHAEIDYGDGRSYRSETMDDAERNMFWHRYSAPGDFTVTVQVTDTEGLTGAASCRFSWTEPVVVQQTTPTTAAASQCHSGYQGACVPIASDVDCAGGSGNGPAYVAGPVYVVGSDPYGLDRDGDGIGCE